MYSSEYDSVFAVLNINFHFYYNPSALRWCVVEMLPGGFEGTTDPSVDIRTADDLVTQGARASAVMVLAKWFRNITVSAPQD